MTNDHDYAKRCLQAVEDVFGRPLPQRLSAKPEIVVHSVRLDEDEPPTIVVDLVRRGRPETLVWRLGVDEFSGTRGATDGPEPPEGVADALLVEALGG